MDFETNFAICIRNGDVAALSALGITKSIANETLVCDVPAKRSDSSLAFPNLHFPTPLVFALCCGQEDAALALIDLGADVTRAVVGWHPIHFAVFGNLPKAFARILEKAPSQASAVTADAKATPLHIAISAGRMASRVIAAGADVNAPNADGNTPLHLACALFRDDEVTLLMQHGADPGRRNGRGLTPTDVARDVGNGKALAIIEKPPKRFEAVDRREAAETEGDEDIVSIVNEFVALSAHVRELEERVDQMQ